MPSISKADNFKYLTLALVLLLFGMAFAQQFADASIQRLMQSTTVVTLIFVVWGVRRHSLEFKRALIFPVLIILTSGAGYWLDNHGLDYAHLLLMLAFFISTANQTARQVLLQGEIDGNKILGSICLYMLLGLIFALLFTLFYLHTESAFNGIESTLAWYVVLPDFVYFSFVTLTTLGYGDISPAHSLTKFLVYIEAIMGQFYLAVLVASLVGSKVSALLPSKKIKNLPV